VVITILDFVSLVLFIIWGIRRLYAGLQAMNAVNTPHSLEADPSSPRKYDGATRRKGYLRAGGILSVIGMLGIVISSILTGLGNEITGAIFGGVGFFIAVGKVLGL
jgi:hypothetical protein